MPCGDPLVVGRASVARAAAVGALLVAAAAGAAGPHPPEQDAQNRKLGLREGPLSADLGVATLEVPEGDVSTGKDGAKAWEALTHNPQSGLEVALVGLPGGGKVLFEYAPLGFVTVDKDDPFTPADAPVGEGGGERPVYDIPAHTLSWRVAHGGDENVHRAILGRHGVVHVTLTRPRADTADDAAFTALLAGFSFKQGEHVEEHVQGEPVAPQGLRALVERSGLALAPRRQRVVPIASGAGIAVLGAAIAVAVVVKRRRIARGERG